MIMGNKRRVYTVRLKNGDEVVLYWPEQLCIVDESLPNFWGVHYVIPKLHIDHDWIEGFGKEKAGEFLIWLDENLPEKTTQVGEFEIIVEEFNLPDIWWAPHPDDYARLKQGKRKKITELPEWQVYFGEETE